MKFAGTRISSLVAFSTAAFRVAKKETRATKSAAFSDARPKDNHPFLFESATPGERLFAPKCL
jgi:hypothetical protein